MLAALEASYERGLLQKKPVLVALDRAPVLADKLLRSLITVSHQPLGSSHFAQSARRAQSPSTRRRIVQASCSLKCSRILSNSQSLAGQCPAGGESLPRDRGRDGANATPVCRGRAEV